MKRMVFYTLLTCSAWVATIWSQTQPVKKYVADNDVRLLAHTTGKPIAALAKGTECKVLREVGEMVQVQITGWIAKSSLLDTPLLRALHIMVETKEQAEQIIAELRRGKSFEELARSKSIAPTAIRGGDLGYFKKGDFDSKIETAILSLQINEITPIIEFNGKYNIFKRIE